MLPSTLTTLLFPQVEVWLLHVEKQDIFPCLLMLIIPCLYFDCEICAAVFNSKTFLTDCFDLGSNLEPYLDLKLCISLDGFLVSSENQVRKKGFTCLRGRKWLSLSSDSRD